MGCHYAVMLSSNKEQFLISASSGANYIPVVKSWPADLETPLTTWLKVGNQRPPGVLLESVEGGETIGRWSVVASDAHRQAYHLSLEYVQPHSHEHGYRGTLQMCMGTD